MRSNQRFLRVSRAFALGFLLTAAFAPRISQADDRPKGYVTLLYGLPTAPVEEAEMGKLKGSAFAGAFGRFFTKQAAWEIMAQRLSFGEVSTSTPGPSPGDPDVVNTMSQTKTFVTGNIRFFLGQYVNAFAGVGGGTTSITVSNSMSAVPESPSTWGIILIYGAGAQLPIGRTAELTAEYEGATLGTNVTQINFGLRFKF